MNIKQSFAVISSLFLIISCGENSSKNENNGDTTVTVVSPPVDNQPVNTTVEVPEGTRASFQAKYPTASSVNWRRYEPNEWFDWTWAGWPVLDSNDYMVSYTDNGVEYWTWYDDRGTWVGTSSSVSDHTSLPAPVSKAVNDNFAGYTITSVRKENDKDRTAYEIKLEKGDDKAKLLVDEKGKVMKKTSKVDGTKTKEKNS